MTSSNLVVPVVMWGQDTPTHCIASLMMVADQHHLVTGCNDGQIIIWSVDEEWQIQPKNMLFGHSAAVTCLVAGSNNTDKQFVVSSADNGEMCLWDIADGRCIEYTKLPMVHTNIQCYQMLHNRDIHLICNGHYPEIHIIHPLSLEIVMTLSSRIQPDWISALCPLRPVKREDDVIVAVTTAGVVKVWTLTSSEAKTKEPVYEDESKQIRCLNAHTLRCCAYNQRTVLLVCAKYWQVYDAGDFSLLCSESSRRGERWTGGEFISVDKVIVWSSEGKGYLFKLPLNAIPSSPEYRKPADPSSPRQIGPQAYTVLDSHVDRPYKCQPTMSYFFGRRGREQKVLLRGDSEGRVIVWTLPEVADKQMKLVRQESFDKLPVVLPKATSSVQMVWESCRPAGVLDQLSCSQGHMIKVTSSAYIPTLGKLLCGREDGSILITSATQSAVLNLLETGTTANDDTLPNQILHGHEGRVNCLLYPCNDSPRYDPSHMISGGADYSVLLWDIFTGAKLHSFLVHGGEIQRLLVPPPDCNPRVLACIASVSSDHSLALLSLRERKCTLMAARQLFPIQTVKWRPLDDYVVLGCTDGSVYIWQMETGHLDRVEEGSAALEILGACDEKMTLGENITNPTISLAQAFRRHNLATFRHMAHQRIEQVKKNQAKGPENLVQQTQRPDATPMLIQGVQSNKKDANSHVIFFDTEALIVQLLGEEFASLNPDDLESTGVLTPTVIKGNNKAVDAQKKIAGFLTKMKNKADDMGNMIQAKAEAGLSPHRKRKKPPPRPAPPRLNSATPPVEQSPPPERAERPTTLKIGEESLTMEVAQLFMSCLHAWGLDPDLDKMVSDKLGLIRPQRSISFGMLSRGGHMSLMLPGWHQRVLRQESKDSPRLIDLSTSPPVVTREKVTFTSQPHWQISEAVTTQHLLSVISVANTLMSMSHATFTPIEKARSERASRQSSVDTSPPSTPGYLPMNGELDEDSDMFTAMQAQIKQGWSLLAALHCVLLPDLVGKDLYQPPQLQMLARKWQDRCLEIREAAQALLLAELRRIGPEGRKAVVDQWSPYLPSYVDPATSLLAEQQQALAQGVTFEQEEEDEDEILEFLLWDSGTKKLSQTYESRRKQATAIVMMGVIGAEFGQEIEPSRRKNDSKNSNKQVAEGFGVTNPSHARHTSKALTFLLLQPPSQKLPPFTPIRRAAIDLLGRGFTVWEPYLDVSAVLLGLLELCVDGDKLVPRSVQDSVTYGLPLSPPADACRTARHALALIATARPPAFVITMAKEVARYNAMLQNAQHHQVQLTNSVLIRAKSEILRVIELLIDKIPNDVADLIVEVMDVTVHCLDQAAVKSRGLQEAFPAICRFTTVSYCIQSRRICVGAKHGGLAFYELKQQKCQVVPAHKGAVTAVAFSPDGKHLASYSHNDNRLLFWQTASSSILGFGAGHTKCIRTYNTQPVNISPNNNTTKVARLLWTEAKCVVLWTIDGTESKYRI